MKEIKGSHNVRPCQYVEIRSDVVQLFHVVWTKTFQRFRYGSIQNLMVLISIETRFNVVQFYFHFHARKQFSVSSRWPTKHMMLLYPKDEFLYMIDLDLSNEGDQRKP
jgi:hypothetical protein